MTDSRRYRTITLLGELPRRRPIRIFRPLRGSTVKKVDLFSLFSLGDIRRLHDVGEKMNDPQRVVQLMTGVQQVLTAFVGDEEHQKNLPSSVAKASQIQAELWVAILNGGQIDWTQFNRTRAYVNELSTLLADECDRLPAFVVEKVRAYSPIGLLEHAEDIFDETAKNNLFPRAKEDFQQAARCLLFDVPTAAGFHALRALESYVRRYYEVVLGRTIAPDDPVRWQQIIDELRKHLEVEKKAEQPDTEALELIVAQMLPIKNILRNPIFHPETVLTRDQAPDVIQLAAQLISAMMRDADRRSPGSMRGM